MKFTGDKVIAQIDMAHEIAEASHRAVDFARTVQYGQIADGVVEGNLFPFIDRLEGKGSFRSHKGFTPAGLIPGAGYWFSEVVWQGCKLTLKQLIEELRQATENTNPKARIPRPKEELRELYIEARMIETILNFSTWGNPLGSWATVNVSRGIPWRGEGKPPEGG